MINIASTICMIFILFGTTNPKDKRPKVFLPRENATVHIDLLETMGKNVLEITFSDFTSKQRVQNVMIVDLRKNQADNISTERTYTGRIEKIEINNGSLSFLLLNASVLDSGHYMVYEDSVVKGNTSILVARQRLLVQDGVSITLPFLCNIRNVTSIKIELMLNNVQFCVVKYAVTQAICTEVGNLYMDRIDSCALRDSNFTFTLRKVSYVDMGTYVAWDDMDLPLDSVFVKVEENRATSSPESTRIYVNSPLIPNIPSPDTENYQFGWILVSELVVVLVATGMVISVFGRLRERKDCCQHSLIDITSDQDLKMGRRSENTNTSAAADEREYEEPRSNTTDLSIYLEPTGIETTHTEDNNPGGYCFKDYEKLNPYENQGNNAYSSLGAEHILENK